MKLSLDSIVLLYPQEKEILYVTQCIDLAKDMGMKAVRIPGSILWLLPEPLRVERVEEEP